MFKCHSENILRLDNYVRNKRCFSLEDVVDQKAEGDYVSLDNVWHSPSPPGPTETLIMDTMLQVMIPM